LQLQASNLHKKSLQNQFKLYWKPIFSMMESCIDIPSEAVDEAFVQSSYRLATEYLKQRVSYVWEMAKDERALDSWTLGTWSKRVGRSQIEKLGTAADKAKLPPATERNKPHQKKRSFTQSQTTFVVHG
jgi:hypothetical protein